MTVSTYGPVNAQTSYLPLEFVAPEEYKNFRMAVIQREQMTANVLNAKENCQYDTQERLSGQQFFSTQSGINKPRYTFRTVINFGALPNNATKSVAHSITTTSTTIFTRIYGSATNPSTQWIPLPYASVTAVANNLELWVDSTNINIKTGVDYSAYTTCYVVVEYLK